MASSGNQMIISVLRVLLGCCSFFVPANNSYSAVITEALYTCSTSIDHLNSLCPSQDSYERLWGSAYYVKSMERTLTVISRILSLLEVLMEKAGELFGVKYHVIVLVEMCKAVSRLLILVSRGDSSMLLNWSKDEVLELVGEANRDRRLCSNSLLSYENHYQEVYKYRMMMLATIEAEKSGMYPSGRAIGTIDSCSDEDECDDVTVEYGRRSGISLPVSPSSDKTKAGTAIALTPGGGSGSGIPSPLLTSDDLQEAAASILINDHTDVGAKDSVTGHITGSVLEHQSTDLCPGDGNATNTQQHEVTVLLTTQSISSVHSSLSASPVSSCNSSITDPAHPRSSSTTSAALPQGRPSRTHSNLPQPQHANTSLLDYDVIDNGQRLSPFLTSSPHATKAPCIPASQLLICGEVLYVLRPFVYAWVLHYCINHQQKPTDRSGGLAETRNPGKWGTQLASALQDSAHLTDLVPSNTPNLMAHTVALAVSLVMELLSLKMSMTALEQVRMCYSASTVPDREDDQDGHKPSLDNQDFTADQEHELDAEVKRRKMALFFNLLRSPLLDRATIPLLALAAKCVYYIPIVSQLPNHLVDVLKYMNRYHFYTSAS